MGIVRDYFARLEFQNRGSPHVHAFFWTDNSPDMETLNGRRHAASIIDKYITALLPQEDHPLYAMVSRLQIHHHTFICQLSKNSTICRFDFPRAVLAATTQP